MANLLFFPLQSPTAQANFSTEGLKHNLQAELHEKSKNYYRNTKLNFQATFS